MSRSSAVMAMVAVLGFAQELSAQPALLLDQLFLRDARSRQTYVESARPQWSPYRPSRDVPPSRGYDDQPEYPAGGIRQRDERAPAERTAVWNQPVPAHHPTQRCRRPDCSVCGADPWRSETIRRTQYLEELPPVIGPPVIGPAVPGGVDPIGPQPEYFGAGALAYTSTESTPRVGIGNLTGEDTGLDNGFSWLQGIAPLWQVPGEGLLFADVRVLTYHDSSEQYGANGALGFRVLNPVWNRILGGYVGYDYRRTDQFGFGQVSAGLENLGAVWDIRGNVYAVTSQDDRVVAITGPRYVQHNIQFDVLRTSAMSGFDAEFGANLTPWSQVLALRAFAGVYGFYDNGSTNAQGVRGRVEARWWNRVSVEGSVQHDQVFDTTGFVSVSVLLGGSRAAAGCRVPLVAGRLADPLEKNMHVVVRQRTEQELAINPRTGSAWTVLHADSNSTAAVPDGTFESPYPTLAQTGANNSAQFDIVLLHAGSAFNGEGIAIPFADQRLLGDSAAVPHTFASQFGTLVLPRANNNLPAPAINMAPVDAVTVAANRVEVSGLNINAPAQNGIAGSDLSGFNINRNTISGAGLDGVQLSGMNNGTLQGNTAINNAGLGFGLGSNLTGGLSGGTISGNTANENGLGFLFGDVSGSTVSDNTANNNAISFGFFFGDVSDSTVGGNTANENGVGFGFGDVSASTVSDNTANNNATSFGFFFGDVSDSAVGGNTANENGVGFGFGDVSASTVSDNTANNNATSFGFFFGDVSDSAVGGNTANANGVGFGFGDVSASTVSDNTANTNGSGFGFSDVSDSTVAGNTANNNANGPGFGFGDVSDSTVGGNTANENGVGFSFGNVSDSTLSGNTANNNTNGSGFGFGGVSDSTLSGNAASGNFHGYFLNNVSASAITDNTANANRGGGIVFQNTFSDGTVSGNTASGNSFNGFFFGTFSSGTVSGNTASGTGIGAGFAFVVMSGGTVRDNTSNGNNGNDGFLFITYSGGLVDSNTAENNGDGFNLGNLGGSVTGGMLNNNTANNNMGMGYNVNMPMAPFTATNNQGTGNVGGGNMFTFP